MLTRAPAIGARRWWYWPWHSLLIAAFPVLFLFAQNTADQVTLEPLWVPLAICLIGAVLLLLLCFGFRRDWPRAGLMATALLALFFSYGHVWNLLDDAILTQQWPLIVHLDHLGGDPRFASPGAAVRGSSRRPRS